MNTLRIWLFGKFQAECGDRMMTNTCPHRAQELLCYLLLYRDQPHHREALTGLLCNDCPDAQSKKSLRQALWQLQTIFESHVRPIHSLLLVEPEWICLNQSTDLWLDIATFEQAFAPVQGIGGEQLDRQQYAMVQKAVELYRGDLLEGWYQDWCLYQRERLQNIYLAMLDKLMVYCEVHHQYEQGIAYGALVLRCDRAHERTHLRLMRLHYLSGDRASALRQYDRCASALQEELNVPPAKRTTQLYEQIRSDTLDAMPTVSSTVPTTNGTLTLAQQAVAQLEQLKTILVEIQRNLQQDTQSPEQLMRGQPR